MGSRSYIGQLREDGKVEFAYCHSGAYMDDNGLTLLKYYTEADKVKALIAGGDMSYIGNADDSDDSYIGDAGSKVSTMPISKFLEYKDISIESLFLFKEGQWHVKSRHVKGGDKEWDLLKNAVTRPAD